MLRRGSGTRPGRARKGLVAALGVVVAGMAALLVTSLGASALAASVGAAAAAAAADAPPVEAAAAGPTRSAKRP